MNKDYLEALKELGYLIDEVSGLTKYVYEYDDSFDSRLEYICEQIEKIKNKLQPSLKCPEAIDNAEPSEALKCLEKVKGYYTGGINSVEVYLEETKDYNIIKQALERLESIDNTNPSEALDYMESLFKCWEHLAKKDDNSEIKEIELEKYIFKENYDIIKQALIKTQETEKNIDYGSARERWKIMCQMIKRMFDFNIEEKWSDDDKVITQALIKAQEQEKILNTIFQNIELDENYSEQCSGSTKAYKLVIPNCISVEEDENYTDDSFPNSDFEVIDNFAKERAENE